METNTFVKGKDKRKVLQQR